MTPAPVITPSLIATRLDITRPPASIRYGSSIVLSGRLRAASTGAGLAGKRVFWCFRAGTRTSCTAATTGSTGWSRVRFTPRATSTVSVRFAGDSRFARVTSASYRVAVVPTVAMWGGHTWLMVMVHPAGRQPYLLQRWDGHRWLRVSSGSTDAAGRAFFTHLAPRVLVRVLIGKSALWAGTSTRAVRVS